MEKIRGCYNCTYRIRLGSKEKCRMKNFNISLNLSNGRDCLYWIRRRCSNCTWYDCIEDYFVLEKPEGCSQYLFATG